MRRHGINSAAADETCRPESVDDDVASALRAAARAVKLDGMRNNRNTAMANATAAGTAHNNPDAGMVCPKNLPKNLHSAGPRARSLPPLPARRLWRPDATAAVPGNAGSAHGAAAARALWTDNAAPHANAASHGPRPDTTGCNTEKADGMAGRASHIPSAGKHATACLRDVEQDCQIGHTQVGPRELLLPQVKPRWRALTRLRGVLIGTSRFRITTAAKGSQGKTLARAEERPPHSASRWAGPRLPVIDP